MAAAAITPPTAGVGNFLLLFIVSSAGQERRCEDGGFDGAGKETSDAAGDRATGAEGRCGDGGEKDGGESNGGEGKRGRLGGNGLRSGTEGGGRGGRAGGKA